MENTYLLIDQYMSPNYKIIGEYKTILDARIARHEYESEFNGECDCRIFNKRDAMIREPGKTMLQSIDALFWKDVSYYWKVLIKAKRLWNETSDNDIKHKIDNAYARLMGLLEFGCNALLIECHEMLPRLLNYRFYGRCVLEEKQ